MTSSSSSPKSTKSVSLVEEYDDHLTFFDGLSDAPPEDRIRGDTPADINHRCLSLCRKYLGGPWLNAHCPDTDIHVKRITSGMCNQLYKVSLALSDPSVISPDTNPEQTNSDTPTVVALKLYLPKLMQIHEPTDDERLNDTLALSYLSQAGLGPRVYGIFADGFIQAFVEHVQFSVDQQQDPELVRKAAQSIARVHHLPVPLPRNRTHWMLTELQNTLDQISGQCPLLDAVIQQSGHRALNAHPLRSEFDRLKTLILDLASPTVFGHGDFRSINTLVTPDRKILLVDPEFCGYSARGYDLATFLMEWGQRSFQFQAMGVPQDSVLEEFVRLYLDECDQLRPGHSSKPENAVSRIVKEIKLFILEQYMFFLLFFLKPVKVEGSDFCWTVPESGLKQAEACYRKYLQVKQGLIDAGVIH